VVISGLQARFELPGSDGAGYPDAYLAFLRTVPANAPSTTSGII
jgi:hypothetical protein